MDNNLFTDMTQIVGRNDILFLCIDCLRFDVAKGEEDRGGTPVLNKYGKWRECQAPGNFTYPSHQAMFAGFMPIDKDIHEMKRREVLFFSQNTCSRRKAPKGAFIFKRPTWIEELSDRGYETLCIGGVGFFDKRTELGSVLPGYFNRSYWNPSFGCMAKESAKNQVDFALSILKKIPKEKRVMMYINFSAVHYPNYFYLDGAHKDSAENPQREFMYLDGEHKDSVESHRRALMYIDGELERLFMGFKKRGETFVICCGDHGTCYGEDGVWYHGVNHPIVNTVPYKHFLL